MQMSELREAWKPMTSKVRLLAVDDDAAIRTMLDRVLDGDGFQVEGAATVGEALGRDKVLPDAVPQGPGLDAGQRCVVSHPFDPAHQFGQCDRSRHRSDTSQCRGEH